MDSICEPKSFKARKKTFQALGGIKKNSFRKGKSLKLSINSISNALGIFLDKTDLKRSNKTFLYKIQKDLLKLARYDKYSKMELFYIAEDLVNKYKLQ